VQKGGKGYSDGGGTEVPNYGGNAVNGFAKTNTYLKTKHKEPWAGQVGSPEKSTLDETELTSAETVG